VGWDINKLKLKAGTPRWYTLFYFIRT